MPLSIQTTIPYLHDPAKHGVPKQHLLTILDHILLYHCNTDIDNALKTYMYACSNKSKTWKNISQWIFFIHILPFTAGVTPTKEEMYCIHPIIQLLFAKFVNAANLRALSSDGNVILQLDIHLRMCVYMYFLYRKYIYTTYSLVLYCEYCDCSLNCCKGVYRCTYHKDIEHKPCVFEFLVLNLKHSTKLCKGKDSIRIKSVDNTNVSSRYSTLPFSVRLTIENPNSYKLSDTLTKYWVMWPLPIGSLTTSTPYLCWFRWTNKQGNYVRSNDT